MRNRILAVLCLLVITAAGAAYAQERGRAAAADREPSAAGAASGAAASRGISVSPGVNTGSVGATTGRDIGHGALGGGPVIENTPRIQGTSFNSVHSYYYWNDYYFYMMARYHMDGLYFRRFYVNSEPLLTPQLMKLTLREPLRLSERMSDAVDELDALVQQSQSGAAVGKDQLRAKAEEIADLAKQVRRDGMLGYVDVRKNRDLARNIDTKSVTPEVVAQLREMVTDLNAQLRDMYNQSSTATVSAASYTAPSLESLSKGIEKLSKSIRKNL